MKGYDYHSLFYYQVLSRLRNLVGANGESVALLSPLKDAPVMRLGYEPREDNYRHNYLRNKHLSSRDKLVSAKVHQDSIDEVILLSAKRRHDEVTVYYKAVEFIFKEDYKEALDELVTLLEKFYKVNVEESSPYHLIDFSANRNGAQERINDLSRV